MKISKISKDLECSVIPSNNLEDNIFHFKNRLLLFRTIATILNAIISVLILLRVFKVI